MKHAQPRQERRHGDDVLRYGKPIDQFVAREEGADDAADGAPGEQPAHRAARASRIGERVAGPYIDIRND